MSVWPALPVLVGRAVLRAARERAAASDAARRADISTFGDPHEQQLLHAHDDSISCLAVSPRGTLLATGQNGENADVVVMHLSKGGKALFRFCEHDFGVRDVAFSHDERLLASVGHHFDRKLIIWDMYTCVAPLRSPVRRRLTPRRAAA